jgi:hypothetical protein
MHIVNVCFENVFILYLYNTLLGWPKITNLDVKYLGKYLYTVIVYN